MNVNEARARPQALIILGMHRSGTSALAGTLVKLGALAPRTLIPATRNNPKGFWESTELMNFHDRLLALGGSQWNDWSRFDVDRMDAIKVRDVVAELSQLLSNEFGDARLMLIKDPRMCRLFPIWEQALEGLGVSPRVVIPFRHPEEVARSLIARNGFSRAQAQLIWLRHVLDAESSTRQVPRVFVGYTELLQDWRATVTRVSHALDIGWPRDGIAVEEEIDAFLSPSLRHHEADGPQVESGTELDTWVSDAYAGLLRLSGDPDHNGTRRRLDAICGSLDRTSAVYAPVIRGERAQSARQLGAVKGQLSTMRKAANAAETESSKRERDQSARINSLAGTIDGMQLQLESQQAAFVRERNELRTEVEQISRELVEQKQAVIVLRTEAKERDRLSDRVARELDVQNAIASSSLADLEGLRSSRSWRTMQRLQRLARFPEPEIVDPTKSDLKLVLTSGLFDAPWYLNRYPDAESCGMHPTVHFLRRGAQEMLSPGPDFDAADYLTRYPDVAVSGVNPLVHYLRYGEAEGRTKNPVDSSSATA